ncbi:hypothetical protein CR969_02110 [Candidatus Saccharibacteria bacterium]|nr:MAG: hypothetical protein CR969_02110 [Candidatus Saccharibacteria bacterium]
MNWLYVFADAVNKKVLGDPTDIGIPNKPADYSDLAAILNVVYSIAGVIAVVMIIIASISYTTSGGDSNKLTSAKNTILYAVIGLALIMLAFGITNYVTGRF